MRIGTALFLSIGLVSAASAQTTTTYSYDGLGRLVGSTVSGGSQTTITYDPAGNRVNYKVAGAANQDPGSPPHDGAGTPHSTIVVVPLNGYTVIPITM